MSQYKYAEIADTVYFWFAANTTAGAAGDGATPLYDVRLAGAAANAAPTAEGTPTLLTHANYSDGVHEIAIDTTGYAAGEYAVFCTLTISTVNPSGFCGSFKLRTAGTAALAVDLKAILGHLLTQTGTQVADAFQTFFDVATPTGTVNEIKSNLTKVNGAAQTATLDTIKAETVLILADTDEALGKISALPSKRIRL